MSGARIQHGEHLAGSWRTGRRVGEWPLGTHALQNTLALRIGELDRCIKLESGDI